MKKFFLEFKKFISRGSVVDLAVGVIIGGAFSKIVSALTNEIIMPFIGALMGGRDFSSYRVVLWNAHQVFQADGVTPVLDAFGSEVWSSMIYYGKFIQSVLDFLIIAIVLFMILKIINGFHNKIERKKIVEEEQEAEAKKIEDEIKANIPAPLTVSEELLVEIRNLLQTKPK